jgi:DNA-binding response OmpR family regulator
MGGRVQSARDPPIAHCPSPIANVSNVLYVDDEDAIRRALTSWLTRRGHTVFTAASTDEAISILKSHEEIEAMFIDIWLGRESGFDLFEWVDMNRPRLVEHIAFVTGAIVRDSDVERSLAAFARPILTKPFELSELEHMIATWASH